MTLPEIATVAGQAGFAGLDLVTAVAIAWAESSGDPMAHGDTDIGSGRGSFGLWQINADAHPEYGPDFTRLYDPQANANAAYAIYAAAGDSFRPWTTFNTGAFESFVSAAETAIASLASTIADGPAGSSSSLAILILLGLWALTRKA